VDGSLVALLGFGRSFAFAFTVAVAISVTLTVAFVARTSPLSFFRITATL